MLWCAGASRLGLSPTKIETTIETRINPTKIETTNGLDEANLSQVHRHMGHYGGYFMKPTGMNRERNDGTPAVFLDRDGTIIEDRGDLSDPSQVVFFRETTASLRRLSARFALFIVTNQSGVAKGTITMHDVERVNAYIDLCLGEHGISFHATYVCPHERSSGCHCIKPNPYFLRKAERDWGIDLGRSFVVGDHPHDAELAVNAGATAVYVLSGHGMHHRHEMQGNTLIASGIQEATDIVLRQSESG